MEYPHQIVQRGNNSQNIFFKVGIAEKEISKEQNQFIEKSFRTGKVLGDQDFKKFLSKKLGN